MNAATPSSPQKKKWGVEVGIGPLREAGDEDLGGGLSKRRHSHRAGHLQPLPKEYLWQTPL